MSIVATVIWVAVGVFYLAQKGFLEVLSSRILSFLCIVLCAAGIFFVAAIGHYSDSMTIGFIAAAGLVELLALILTKVSAGNDGLCQIISIFLLPLTSLIGMVEMLSSEKWWLTLVILPAALFAAVKIREIISAYRKNDLPQWMKSQQPQEKISPEMLMAIRKEVEREFPTQEQVSDIIKRYNLPRHYSQYSHEVYSRWRDEEVQRRANLSQKRR